MSENLRISGCIADSIVDGPGMRFVVFVQGCPHHCPGCHNPQTHDFAGGYLADPEKIVKQVKHIVIVTCKGNHTKHNSYSFLS